MDLSRGSFVARLVHEIIFLVKVIIFKIEVVQSVSGIDRGGFEGLQEVLELCFLGVSGLFNRTMILQGIGPCDSL